MEAAKKISKKYEIGDVVDIEIVPKNFGRIAAQTAKQVVVQKIREAERDIVYTRSFRYFFQNAFTSSYSASSSSVSSTSSF